MKTRTPVLIAMLVATTAVVAFAGSPWEARRENVLRAGPAVKQRVAETVRTKYPDLGSKVVAYLLEQEPRFFTQALLARMKAARSQHADAFSTLPAQVLEDVHTRYPRLLPQVAIELWSLAAEKAPDAPRTLRQHRLEHGPRAVIRRIVAEKYPTLPEDILGVARTRHSDLLAAVRSDVARTVAATDPSLRLDIAFDTLRLVRSKHPEALVTLIRQPGPAARMRAFRDLMDSDPAFAVAFWKMMEEKYADRTYKVVHAVVETVARQHGKRLHALVEDVVTLVDTKYATLPGEAIQGIIAERKAHIPALAQRYPDLPRQLAARLQAKFPKLGSDVVDSIDRHSPGLRRDLRQAVDQRFPGLRDRVHQLVLRTHPDFEQTMDGLLKNS